MKQLVMEVPDELVKVIASLLAALPIKIEAREVHPTNAVILDTPAQLLKLRRVRIVTALAHNVIVRKGYGAIEDICRDTEKGFLEAQYSGPKSLALVKEALAELGLSFGMSQQALAEFRQKRYHPHKR